MSKSVPSRVLAALSLAILAGCSSTPSELAVKTHTAKAQCAGIDSGLTRVTPQSLQRLQQRQFLTEESSQSKSESADATQLLIAVSHGAQPSPGYGFELRNAVLSDGVAELNLHWVTPPAGSIQATVMTNPCLVLALPKGGYQKVVAQDQTGVIGSLALDP